MIPLRKVDETISFGSGEYEHYRHFFSLSVFFFLPPAATFPSGGPELFFNGPETADGNIPYRFQSPRICTGARLDDPSINRWSAPSPGSDIKFFCPPRANCRGIVSLRNRRNIDKTYTPIFYIILYFGHRFFKEFRFTSATSCRF